MSTDHSQTIHDTIDSFLDTAPGLEDAEIKFDEIVIHENDSQTRHVTINGQTYCVLVRRLP